MLATIGTVENFMITPSPILDESEQGYHLEERLQVTLKSAIDEHPLLVEFRLGDTSAAPSEQVLATWLVEDELVAALCTGVSVRPVAQKPRQQAQGGEHMGRTDTIVVLAGQSMVALSEGIDLREAVKSARAAHKRAQRDYLLRRNAERVEQLKSQLPERIQQLKMRQGVQAPENAPTAAATSSNGPQRNAERVEPFRAQLPVRLRQFTERGAAQDEQKDKDEDDFMAAETSPNGLIR